MNDTNRGVCQHFWRRRGRNSRINSGQAPDDISVIFIRFILDNWKPIMGFIITTLLPFIAEKLTSKRIPEIRGKVLLPDATERD